ncbi:DUF6838 family protein [Clostridium sp.]|uniref:phage tail terminator family protein n=1 Tax=Clostridium sp. TaxID=1506 RepID=UPI002903AA42|nr:hypothetical protein [Clostridium sp.]MDU7260736.1 hypothetical protein [Clostridium butyricum]MDU1068188.1 hypothetical protein [Clostridium sp.]MDU2679762.1 hypothetical protein [Clostridium sp.]MDU4211943.1 hypothetical protein [Clostridium sp.]MDU5175102.1 hypothetical protein [Clostridium sp.]
MIKYNELLYYTGKTIRDHFKDSELRKKKNMEDVKKSTFFVEVRPLSSNSYKSYATKLVNITITYTDKTVDSEKLNDVLNDLESIFDLGIKVKDTFLMFKNKSYSIDDDFLSINLTINYFDDKDTVDENDFYSALMDELYIDLN